MRVILCTGIDGFRKRANSLHHPGQPVAAGHREVLIQANLLEESIDIKVHNLLRRLAGEELLQNRDQATNDIRI